MPVSDPKPIVVLGLLGTTLDTGKGPKRWERWRPTVSLCQHEDFIVDRLELIHDRRANSLAEQVIEDIGSVSPETDVVQHTMALRDPWDFDEVFAKLHDFARAYPFDTDREDYLVHITTGTHVVQICNFLLTESGYFPARLIQTSPPRRAKDGPGLRRIIDLDLSKYDQLASRFQREHDDAVASLKDGIETRNIGFNTLIERVEHVAVRTSDPILLTGPTGAGKSKLAERIFDLRRHRRMVEGSLVVVNCATLRGDSAMSTLFGHRKGAFTGAASDRPGLLRQANGGLLFLDEIGELGLDEQAMLLRAIEEQRFMPLGADTDVQVSFQLIAGTNRDLRECVRDGTFRDDLLARINLWSFELPALRDRAEDIEPNVDFELERFTRERGHMVRFNREAREAFLSFACAPTSRWSGNFRDLNAALTRMATLAPGGRITSEVVEEEQQRLEHAWACDGASEHPNLSKVMRPDKIDQLDLFDRLQLDSVLGVCANSDSLSAAGRSLFAASRSKRSSTNDSDRIRKYLGKYGLNWDQIRSTGSR
ncbi:MAG: RNA repair transcriptional activator RtcR [Phycisphaerales bacterium]